MVPAAKQLAYRWRKVEVTQNITTTCSFNMLFTYVYIGWERTTNDARVLMDAIKEDDNFPMPPEGKEINIVEYIAILFCVFNNLFLMHISILLLILNVQIWCDF